MSYPPGQKPPQWSIDPGVVAYNASRMGLPTPIGLWAMWEKGGKTILNLADGKLSLPFVETGGVITWAVDYLHWETGDYDYDYKYIDTGKSPVYTQGLTIFAVLNCEHEYTSQNSQRIVCQHKNGDYGYIFTRVGTDDKLGYLRSSNGTTWDYLHGTNNAFPLNEKMSVAIVDDGTNVQFYKNGLAEGSAQAITNTGVVNSSAGNLWIGADEYQLAERRFGWQGSMWIVIVFDNILNSAQMASLHANSYGLVADSYQIETLGYVAAAGGVSVDASVDALVLTEHAAGVNKKVSLTTGIDALVIDKYAADVSLGMSISAGVDELAITEYGANVKVDINLTAGIDALVLTEYGVGANAEVNIMAGIDAFLAYMPK